MAKRPTTTSVSAPEVTADATQRMATYRHGNLNYEFSELRREDFEDDKTYCDALLEQYEALRQQEYEYICRNEALKTYNCSCDGRNAGIVPNQAWDGYQNSRHKKFLEQHPEHADSSQVQQFPKLCRDPDKKNSVVYKKKDGSVKSVGAYSCALTSTAMQMQISDKMGYKGVDNLITPNQCYASATDAASCADKKYLITGEGKTLNQMIASGEIGVGDEVSTYTPGNKRNNAQNSDITSSGKHCITIAAINRNEKGEIVSFTYQANNVETFREVKITDNSGQGGKVVWNAVKTHTWAQDKIEKEIKQFKQKTTAELIAELPAKVAKARQRTNDLIDDLQKTEQIAATHRRNSDKKNYLSNAQVSYQDELTRRKENYYEERDREIVLRVERENAQKEAELKEREREVQQKEAEYEAKKIEFLKAHPEKEEEIKQKDKERAETTGTPEHPEVVEIPPATTSQDWEERKRNAMERKDALEKKEQELIDREFNASERDSDLLFMRENLKPTKEEKKANKKKLSKKKQQKEDELRASMKKGERTSADLPEGEAISPEAAATEEAITRAETTGAFREHYTDAHIDTRNATSEARAVNERSIATQQQSAQQEQVPSQEPAQSEQTPPQQPVQSEQTPPQQPVQSEGAVASETWEMTQDGKLIKVEKGKGKDKPKTEIPAAKLIEYLRQKRQK